MWSLRKCKHQLKNGTNKENSDLHVSGNMMPGVTTVEPYLTGRRLFVDGETPWGV